MKNSLIYIFLFFLCTSCDPTDLVWIENNKKVDSTIIMYFKNSKELKSALGFEDFDIDRDSTMLVTNLKPNEEVLIAGAPYGKDIENKDFHFYKIQIIIVNDTLELNKKAFIHYINKNSFYDKKFKIN